MLAEGGEPVKSAAGRRGADQAPTALTGRGPAAYGGVVRAALIVAAALGLAVPSALPAGQPEPAPAASGGLDLSIRSRGLGITADPPTGTNIGVEPARPRTGAGTTRWPSAVTELAPGVYLTVVPACIPGVDEPLMAPRPLPGRRR